MFFGSFYGLFFYSCGMLAVATYSIFLYNGIKTHEKDKYQTITAANDYSPEFNNLYIDEFNFMPLFEIRTIKYIDPKFDIFKS